MELKWLLLLPVYRYAYIGMIANAYAKEQHVEGVNYSVYEVVLSTVFIGCAVLTYTKTTTITVLALCAISVLWAVVRMVENFTIFKMFNKHPFWFSLIGCLPGVMLYKAKEALRVLETM